MTSTAKILFRPDGWTDEILLYPIGEAAERIKKSRRQVDKYIAAGRLTQIKVHGLSCIPAHELQKFMPHPGSDTEESSDGE